MHLLISAAEHPRAKLSCVLTRSRAHKPEAARALEAPKRVVYV